MAEPVRKHFVHWYTFEADMISSVESRDPKAYHAESGAWWFQFYDVMELDVEVDGQTLVLKSAAFNHSPMYLVDATPGEPDTTYSVGSQVRHSLGGEHWVDGKKEVFVSRGGARFAVPSPVEILAS